MNHTFYLLLALLGSFFLTSCEEDISIDLPAGEEKLVVQGHIEQGAPPFVILSRSIPIFTSIASESFINSLVHQATVIVRSEGKDYSLSEVPLTSLPADQQQLMSEQFGLAVPIEPNSPLAKVTVYTTPDLQGAIGKSYSLQIAVEGKTLSATTTIPVTTPVDSLWFKPHPNSNNDSLVSLWYRYRDPDTLGNNVRFFTSRNSEPYYSGYQASVLTDEFVNGRTIDFPLERGHPKSAKVDLETYSYFKKGDTVRLKWGAIDYQHYQFWFTLEADRASNGNPLGFPTTVRSNINGGLGIWGGYGVSRHSVISR